MGTGGVDRTSVRQVDWLRHEWRFEVAKQMASFRPHYAVSCSGTLVSFFPSREEAEEWISTRRRCCLAEVVASAPALRPALVIIAAGHGARLARIPPDFWGTYDALLINRTADQLMVLSAKALAMFPGDDGVRIIIARR
jgi:hypothetical protein